METAFGNRANPGIAAEGITKISRENVIGTYGNGEPFELAEAVTTHSKSSATARLPSDLMISPARRSADDRPWTVWKPCRMQTLLALADPDDKDGDGISGTVNRVSNPQSGEADDWPLRLEGEPADACRRRMLRRALGDIGLTNPLFTQSRTAQRPANLTCSPPSAATRSDLSDKLLRQADVSTRD